MWFKAFLALRSGAACSGEPQKVVEVMGNESWSAVQPTTSDGHGYPTQWQIPNTDHSLGAIFYLFLLYWGNFLILSNYLWVTGWCKRLDTSTTISPLSAEHTWKPCSATQTVPWSSPALSLGMCWSWHITSPGTASRNNFQLLHGLYTVLVALIVSCMVMVTQW